MKKRFLLLFLLLMLIAVTASDNSYNWVRPPEAFNLPATGHFFMANETPVLITMGAVNLYYNLTPFQKGVIRNIGTFNMSYFNITYNGTYDIFWQLSFLDGANKEFETVVFVNDIEGHQCESNRKLGAGGDVGSHSARCYLDLIKGDEVNIRIKDITNPAPASITIQAAQFNINRITAAGTTTITQSVNTTINTTITNNYNTTINQTINTTIYIENGTYATVKRSDAINYHIGLPTGTEDILTTRIWQDETITVFVRQTDVPRNLQVIALNLDLANAMTGTVVVNGSDADGTTLSETFTVNVGAGGAPATYIGDKAFAIITSIEADKTGSSSNGLYSVGVGEKIGFPNYPLNTNTDIIKVVINTIDYPLSGYTANATYGTVDVSPTTGIRNGDVITVWYRPFK